MVGRTGSLNIPRPIAVGMRKRMVTRGAAHVKVGQLLSCRPDLIGEEAAEVFSVLRRDVPPVDRRIMEDVFTADTGMPAECLGNIIASGSIGQVYMLLPPSKTGKFPTAVVKILRPGIVEETNSLIDISIKRFGFSSKIVDLLEDIRNIMLAEADIKTECLNMRRFRKMSNTIQIPREFKSTKNILIMQYLPVLSDPKYSENSLKTVLTEMLIIFAKTGSIHCDLHEGNYGFTKDGKFVLYDFGSIIDIDTLAVKKIVCGIIIGNMDMIFDGVIEAELFRDSEDIDVKLNIVKFCAVLENTAKSQSDFGSLMKTLSTKTPVATNRGFSLFRSFATMDTLLKRSGTSIEDLAPDLSRAFMFDREWLSLVSGVYQSTKLKNILRSL